MDANVIAVHIVFHAFYERIRSELALHRVPLRMWPRVVHRRLYYKLAKFLERRIYGDPRVHLVAVSSLVAAQLKLYFQREDVAVIHNAVDTGRFNPESRMAKRNSSRDAFSYNETDFVLLLIGNDWKKKGLDALLLALSSLRDIPLFTLVVGSDDPNLYRASIDELGLQNRVRFEKPSNDVLSFYAVADLYVGPSLEDSFALPVLEAMACGLPVIVSPNAGVSELIHDRKTGFILRDPQDSLELASLIRRIQGEDALRFSIGRAAARFVMTHCSWDDNAEKTIQLLESIVTNSKVKL